jgi:hypothetical protein
VVCQNHEAEKSSGFELFYTQEIAQIFSGPSNFKNFHKPIRQLCFIAASGPGNFLKLPLTDLAIIIYCQLRI